MNNKLVRYILVIVLAMIILGFLINASKEFSDVMIIFTAKEFVSFFKITETTKSAFGSSELMLQMIKAKLVYNPMIVIVPVLLFITGLLALVFKKKISNAVSNDDMFRSLNLVYDEQIEDGKDSKGKIRYKKVTHVPELDFTELKEKSTFMIHKVHPKIEKNVTLYLTGLLQELHAREKIDVSEGVVQPTGRPGEFRITLLTDALREKQRGESVLKKCGLCFSLMVGDKTEIKYPEIEKLENGNLIINCTKVNISKDLIQNALASLSNEYKKRYFYVIEKSLSVYEVICSKKAEMLINTTIEAEYDKFLEGPVKKLKDLWEESKQFHWYFGTLRDGALILKDNDLIISGDDIVHAMLIGTSGSGKTESLKTICMTLHTVYRDDIEIYYANGSQGSELDLMCKILSPMGLEAAKAKGKTQNEQLVRLLNILQYCKEMGDSRGNLFKETSEEFNMDCRKISDYRKITGKKMPEIIVAIDEFAGYSNLFDYNSNCDTPGTIANLLQIVFSQYRKFGIHILLATQECKAASIPRRLFTNIQGGVLMKIGGGDKTYMESSLAFDFQNQDPTTFKKGNGLFWSSTIICQVTGADKIPSKTYYIGDDGSLNKLIERIDCPYPKDLKRDYDPDMLNLSDKDLDFSKLSPRSLQTIVEKTFLEREGWIVVRRENPNHKIVNLFAKHPKLGTYISIAFAGAEDVLTPNFYERLEREEVEETEMRVYFISGKTDGRKYSDVRDTLLEYSVCQVLTQSEYLMPLRQAYDCFLEKDDTPVFTPLMGSVELQNQARQEKMLKSLYETKLNNNKIYLNKLNEIRSEESSSKKGEQFEHFFIILERSKGHDTILGPELAIRGHVNIKFANPRAEGGLDAFRWTDKEKKRGIGFQLKNQMSKPLDTKVIDKMVKTKQLYEAEGVIFDEFYLVTTGTVTSQTREEARKLKFGIIEGDRLNTIVISSDTSDYMSTVENEELDMVNNLFTETEIQEIAQASIKNKSKMVINPEKTLDWIDKNKDAVATSEIHMKDDKPKEDMSERIRQILNPKKKSILEEEKEYIKKTEESKMISGIDMITEVIEEVEDSVVVKSKLDLAMEKRLIDEAGSFFKVEDWDQFRKIPRTADKRAILSGFGYVAIKNSKITLLMVKNPRPSKKYGKDINDLMMNAMKVLKNYKIKANNLELHYGGDLNPDAIDKKVKVKRYD